MRNSRIIPVALILIIVAVAIAALISLARAVFFANSSQTSSQVDISQSSLLNTALNHSVTMTVRGPIVANEKFHSYQIVITPISRTITVYTGYLDTKMSQISLGNNTPAYEQFVYALNRANYVKNSELTGDQNDRRGICAVGEVYEFSVLTDNKSVKTLWTTTCSNAKGSLGGNYATFRSLFIDQIPNSQDLIFKVNL
jgi:hypothetical protein